MRSIILGLSIAGVTPISFAQATIDNVRPITPSRSNITAKQTVSICDPKLSIDCVNTVPQKTNSDIWLQKITSFLLPNVPFSNCQTRSPLVQWYNQKLSYHWQDDFDRPSIIATASSSKTAIASLMPIDLECVVTRSQQQQSSRQTFDPKSASNHTQQKSTTASIPESLPEFPKLSRSSLIVSFPQEDSSFVPSETKFVNPAPETERIASPFGWRRRPYSNQQQFHQGIDYGAPYGSSVVAVGNGIVTRVVSGCADFGSIFCGGQMGNWIEVDHGNGSIATYGHLKNGSITVKAGMKVSKNQNIAQVGSSGWSTGAHLDFRLKMNGKYQDPANYVMAIDRVQTR